MYLYEIIYEDLYYGREFSESYKKWIKGEIKNEISKKIKVSFTEKSVTIDATKTNQFNLCKALMFIGYAFGQQENGR